VRRAPIPPLWWEGQYDEEDQAFREGDWRHGQVEHDVWPKAIHTVAIGELTPEQAVDAAIARIKQLLSEQPQRATRPAGGRLLAPSRFRARVVTRPSAEAVSPWHVPIL
jgi:hypothetical protein